LDLLQLNFLMQNLHNNNINLQGNLYRSLFV
jgi:hypothetical protein